VLNVSKEKISDKMIKNVEERVTRVLDYVDVTQDGLYEALMRGFVKGKNFSFGKLEGREEKRASELAARVYGSDEWNFSR
jgi:lipoate-protein ligase A